MAPALVHHFPIPLEAIRFKGREDKVGSSRHLSRRIYVFDAYQPAPAPGPGLQKAAEGRNQGAKMERPRRRGGEAADIGARLG